MRRSLVLAVVVVLFTAVPAVATHPGSNGEILFLRFKGHSFFTGSFRTILPDGSGGTGVDRLPLSDTAAWSPDGASIAYGGLTQAPLVILEVDSGTRTRVVSGDELPPNVTYVSDIAFAPAGDRLVFCARLRAGSSSQLYTVGTDGSDLTMISGDLNLCGADWSSTDRIVSADSFRLRPRLYTLDPDGSNVSMLARLQPTKADVRVGLAPSWAPDGQAVAFVSNAGIRRSDIWLIDHDGDDLRRFTDTRRRWEFTPEFAPDGTAIAYSRRGRRLFSTADLWIGNLAGGRSRLTSGPRADDRVESWRPI